MQYPELRLRRLRQSGNIRALLQENTVGVEDLIMPIFVCEGNTQEIPTMKGIYNFSLEDTLKEVQELVDLDILGCLLFGVPKPKEKDAEGSESWNDNGITQKAIRAIKAKFPEFIVMADMCFCSYTTHGHCGVMHGEQLNNDATLGNLAKQAVSFANAGADVLAPSAMIDGQVKIIRKALDKHGFSDKIIMSYSAKFASGFYAPFRDAADCSPQFGDRKTYQINPANSTEAMREIEQDIKEGADIIMIKPAMAYLDIVYQAKQKFNYPTAVYNVSGEYAMMKNTADENLIYEILTGFKRAGADIIITYFTKEFARWKKN